MIALRPSLSRPAIYTAVLAPPILIVVAVVLQPWFDPRWAFMDPIIAGELSGDCCHFYYGFVSNVGVLYMAAAAAICLFGAVCLLGTGRDRTDALFLGVAGLFTGWLCLDDFFLLHEGLLPMIGAPQVATFGVYGLLACAFVLTARRYLLRGEIPLLTVAIALLGSSAAIDVLAHSTERWAVLAEDAAKFGGMAAWSGYFVLSAYSLLASAPRASVKKLRAAPFRPSSLSRSAQ